MCCVWTFAERVKEQEKQMPTKKYMIKDERHYRADGMRFDLIFLSVALPFNFFMFWDKPLTALLVFVTMLFLRYVSPVGE